MKLKAAVVLLSFLTAVAAANAQSSSHASNPENEVREYWIDLSTGLMWAAKDNGKDVSRKDAVRYCRTLRLAGYSDWRLATLNELKTIYDRNANAPGLADKGSEFPYHVKGNLFLTGDEWSSERLYDDRGHPSGYDWYFDFNEGISKNDPSGFPYPRSLLRALCVRASER
jgi:Protein of unknown function (DUF1566)